MTSFPVASLKVTHYDRPWWAFWRTSTVTVTCSEHGVLVTGLVPLITESGLDFVDSIVQVHVAESHRKTRDSQEES